MTLVPLFNFTCPECADEIWRSLGLQIECPEQVFQDHRWRCFTCLRREGFISSSYPLWYEISTPHGTAHIIFTASSDQEAPSNYFRVTGPRSHTESDMQRMIRDLTQSVADLPSQESGFQGQDSSVSIIGLRPDEDDTDSNGIFDVFNLSPLNCTLNNSRQNSANSVISISSTSTSASGETSTDLSDVVAVDEETNLSGSGVEPSEAAIGQINQGSTTGGVVTKKETNISSSDEPDKQKKPSNSTSAEGTFGDTCMDDTTSSITAISTLLTKETSDNDSASKSPPSTDEESSDESRTTDSDMESLDDDSALVTPAAKHEVLESGYSDSVANSPGPNLETERPVLETMDGKTPLNSPIPDVPDTNSAQQKSIQDNTDSGKKAGNGKKDENDYKSLWREYGGKKPCFRNYLTPNSMEYDENFSSDDSDDDYQENKSQRMEVDEDSSSDESDISRDEEPKNISNDLVSSQDSENKPDLEIIKLLETTEESLASFLQLEIPENISTSLYYETNYLEFSGDSCDGFPDDIVETAVKFITASDEIEEFVPSSEISSDTPTVKDTTRSDIKTADVQIIKSVLENHSKETGFTDAKPLDNRVFIDLTEEDEDEDEMTDSSNASSHDEGSVVEPTQMNNSVEPVSVSTFLDKDVLTRALKALTEANDSFIESTVSSFHLIEQDMLSPGSPGSEKSVTNSLSWVINTSFESSPSPGVSSLLVASPASPGSETSDNSFVYEDSDLFSPTSPMISANVTDLTSVGNFESDRSSLSQFIDALIEPGNSDTQQIMSPIQDMYNHSPKKKESFKDTDGIPGNTGPGEVNEYLPVINLNGLVTLSDLENHPTVVQTDKQLEHREPERPFVNLPQINGEIQSYVEFIRKAGSHNGDSSTPVKERKPNRRVLKKKTKARKYAMPYSKVQSRKITNDTNNTKVFQSYDVSHNDQRPVNSECSTTTSPASQTESSSCPVDLTEHSPVSNSGTFEIYTANHAVGSPWLPCCTRDTVSSASSARRHMVSSYTANSAGIGPMRTRVTMSITKSAPLYLSDRERRMTARKRADELLNETRFNDMMNGRTFGNMDMDAI